MTIASLEQTIRHLRENEGADSATEVVLFLDAEVGSVDGTDGPDGGVYLNAELCDQLTQGRAVLCRANPVG